MDQIGTRNPNEHRIAPRRKIPGCNKWTDNFEGIGKLYVSQTAEDQLLDKPLGPRVLRESMLDREMMQLKAHVQGNRRLKGVPNPGYSYAGQVPSGLPSKPQDRSTAAFKADSHLARHPSDSNFSGGSLFLTKARPGCWEDLDCGAPVRRPIDDWTSAMRVHQMSGVAAAEGVRGGTQWLDPANRHGLDSDFHAPPFNSAGASVSLLATQAGKEFFGELVVPGSDTGSDVARHRGAGGFVGKDMEDHFDGGSVILDASVSTDVDAEGFFGTRFAGKDVQDHFEDGGGMVVSEFLDGEGDELHIDGAGEKAAGKRKLVARPQGKKQRATSVSARDGEGARAALLEAMSASASATNAELLNTLNDEANFRTMRRASYAGDAVAKLLSGASMAAPEKKRAESSKRVAARRASHGGQAASELLQGLVASEGAGDTSATHSGRNKNSNSLAKILTQTPVNDEEHKIHRRQSVSMKGGRKGTDAELHGRMHRHSLTLGGEALRPSDAELRRAAVKAGHIKRTITDDQTFKHTGTGAHRDSSALALVLFNR